MPKSYTEVEIKKFDRILERLGDETMVDLSRFDLLVHGRGGQSREFYAALSKDPDIEILKCGSEPSGILRLLASFLPLESGVIRVLNPARLKMLFQQLGGPAVAEIYYIPKELTRMIAPQIFKRDENVLNALSDHTEYVYIKAQLDDYVQQDSEYYYLYDYRLGAETAAVIRTVFNGL